MDFTSVSINALKYAIDCFSKSKLTILHVRSGMLETTELVGISMNLDQAKFWKNSMKTFISKELQLPNFPDHIDVIAEVGAVNIAITQFAEKNNVDCIIMGTRDKYNLFDRWFGSISYAVVKNCTVPLYLIPKYAKYKGHNKIMIASDYKSGDSEFLKKIKSWNKYHNANIHFLHIQNKLTDNFNEVKSNIVKHLFEDNELEFTFEVEVIKEKEITHSLLATAYNKGIDLLVAIPEKKTFLKSLIFKSISKELILQSEIPILFINK